MAKFYVRQIVTQTLVYLVDDAKNYIDAVSQVNDGLVPIAYEENGDLISTTVSLAQSDAPRAAEGTK